MQSTNMNIAHQVRRALLDNKETVMALRGQSKSMIRLFFRNDKLQKLNFDDFRYSLIGDSIDDDFDEMPQEIYKNLCILIINDIAELKIDLNHRFIEISWEYDSELVEIVKTSLAIKKEIHFNNRI